MTSELYGSGPAVLDKRRRKPSPDLEAMGQWIDHNLPPGWDVTSDDLLPFWEARQVAPAARGVMLSAAVGRGWLIWQGRVQKSRRSARKGAYLMVYRVPR